MVRLFHIYASQNLFEESIFMVRLVLEAQRPLLNDMRLLIISSG